MRCLSGLSAGAELGTMSLRVQAVSPHLWRVLQRLMSLSPLQPFYLVGGTALALRYGHRMSEDIDLFTHGSFDAVELSDFLVGECGLTEFSVEANTILGVIDGIKVDCIAHQYPLLAEVETAEDVRLLAVEDIAAMKLNAITNRGSKKDFWDVYELMQHFSRETLLGFFEQKYPQASCWGLEKSLVYFEDAELEPDPVCLKGRKWEEVKAAIQEWNRLSG